MDKCQCEETGIDPEVCNRKDHNPKLISIMHHNVQSLNNKLLELEVLLQTDLKGADVLCFTEHWLKEERIKLLNTDQFKFGGNGSEQVVHVFL
jgi:hypothetical protein